MRGVLTPSSLDKPGSHPSRKFAQTVPISIMQISSCIRTFPWFLLPVVPVNHFYEFNSFGRALDSIVRRRYITAGVVSPRCLVVRLCFSRAGHLHAESINNHCVVHKSGVTESTTYHQVVIFGSRCFELVGLGQPKSGRRWSCRPRASERQGLSGFEADAMANSAPAGCFGHIGSSLFTRMHINDVLNSDIVLSFFYHLRTTCEHDFMD